MANPFTSPLSQRGQEVLHEIVEEYIATGEPVASRTIARGRHDHLSAASIRNVMQDLVDEGYLMQPHTSAGRVPTEKAFQAYVQSLGVRRLVATEIERLRFELGRLNSVEQRIEFTSRLLTEKTRSVGIAAMIPRANPTLEHLELVALPDNRVLMVVMTRNRQVSNRVVFLDQPLDADDLAPIKNYVNRNFQGWVLEDVRRELSSRLAHAEAAYDAVLSKLNLLYLKGLLDLGNEAEVRMEGASNLVVLDLHLTKEKLRELFRALEEKKRVLELLDRFLENSNGEPVGEVAVHVGLGEVHPAMRELSMIGVPVRLDTGLSAVIAVLGPMRMDYGRVMSTVRHLGQAFGEA